MVGECQTQKPVNFMTRSKLDNSHHSWSSSQKGSIWEAVQVTRETYFKRNLLS